VGPREAWYRDTFAERSPQALATRLRAEGIDYVAIDDGLRAQTFAPRLNEELFQEHFEQAFLSPNGGNGNLAIYRVPRDAAVIEALPDAAAANMYEAGGSAGPDGLDAPRGLVAERAGTLLIADSGNGRIQRYSSAGNPIDVLGGPGSGPGQFDTPVGVAVDLAGRIWVADAGNRRLQLLAADGSPIQEFSGPGDGFAALADIDTDNDRVFALDGGTGQVTSVDPDGTMTTWAGAGSGQGQLLAPTGLASKGGIVVVADTGNARVVVFGSDGSYLREWQVPEWQALDGQTPDVTTDGAGTVWLTSPATDAVLVYRDDGTLVGSLPTAGPDALSAPSGITRRPSGSLYVSNSGDDRISLLLQTQP
jgi:sugar lactone lactonase YvrE